MRTLFNIIIILFFFKSSGQVKSGYVTYGESVIEMIIDTSKIKEDNMKTVILNQERLIEKSLSADEEFYELKFNSKKSKFNKLPFVNNESNSFLKYALWPGIFYIDLSNKTSIKQTDVFGETFLIKDTISNIKWKIHNEKKTIGKYNCLKATALVSADNGKDINISAWFSPEIPFAYGPFNYSGLPGLILELERYGRLYYAKNIILNKDSIEIIEPYKGIKMNSNEYLKMIDEMKMRRKNN